jgi:tetratricopeptide (TPR) repeat protein
VLSAAGRRVEAVLATQEAVALIRELFIIDPFDSVERLARWLTQLGTQLSALGRLEEGLAALREAVQHLREGVWFEDYLPKTHTVESLHQLGLLLGEMGRREEAEACREEEVGILVERARSVEGTIEEGILRSAGGSPGRKTPSMFHVRDLAQLGALLSDLGRWEEALDEPGRSDKPGMAAWPCLPSGITRIMLR